MKHHIHLTLSLSHSLQFKIHQAYNVIDILESFFKLNSFTYRPTTHLLALSPLQAQTKCSCTAVKKRQKKLLIKTMKSIASEIKIPHDNYALRVFIVISFSIFGKLGHHRNEILLLVFHHKMQTFANRGMGIAFCVGLTMCQCAMLFICKYTDRITHIHRYRLNNLQVADFRHFSPFSFSPLLSVSL